MLHKWKLHLFLFLLNCKYYQNEILSNTVWQTFLTYFLPQCWRLETSSRPFYYFIKMTTQRDLAIYNSWHLLFLNVPYSPFKEKWNTGILEQVAKFKRTWNLATVLQKVQKIPKSYCPCLHLSNRQVCWL